MTCGHPVIYNVEESSSAIGNHSFWDNVNWVKFHLILEQEELRHEFCSTNAAHVWSLNVPTPEILLFPSAHWQDGSSYSCAQFI
jgi:hypothetical protein